MAMNQAKTLSRAQFKYLMRQVMKRTDAIQCLTILAFSFKCGLRASEIAQLRWKDVTDAEGSVHPVGNFITLPSNITKGSVDGVVVMHKMVYGCLVALQKQHPKSSRLFTGRFGKPLTPNALTVYLYRLFSDVGFSGCSSHSGRRTFITNLARVCNDMECSLADVQKLARHKNLKTTELYIDLSKRVADLSQSI